MAENGISVYVANLGRYNERALAGGRIDLPVPKEDLQDFLEERVGIVPGSYEEYAIHDYDFDGILKSLGFRPDEYEPLEDLNDLAWLTADLDDTQLAAVAAAAEVLSLHGQGTALKLSNLALQADEIPFAEYRDDRSDMSPREKLGRAVAAEDPGFSSVFENGLEHLIDYEKYGEEAEAGAFFAFDDGYLDATQDIPSESFYSREEAADRREASSLLRGGEDR